jgi:hypothetical protein
MDQRWLVRWGGAFVLALGALAILILLLVPLPTPTRVRPSSQSGAIPAGGAPEAGAGVAREAPPSDDEGIPEAPGPGWPSEEPESGAPPGPGADEKGDIVDLQRVQGRGQTPTSRPAPVPGAPQREGEFDRSSEARQRGIEAFGGTPQTESAVEAGLAWLAVHQSPDGSWDRFNFAELDPPGDRCSGRAIRRMEASLDAGVTGLCLLTFLGAGYTDRVGPYQQTVGRAVDVLLRLQREHGGFGPGVSDGMAGYNDSLATFALAEYYAMTHAGLVAGPLRRAADRLVRNQQTLGGWDYEPRPDSGRNDTSITAWVVQALHACAAAGIEVPAPVLVKAALHFGRAALPDGQVWYSDAGTGFGLDSSGLPKYRCGPSMIAAGLTCEQLLGWRIDGPVPQRQKTVLFSQPPSAAKARGQDRTELHGEYYWYYGTVAMFQRGGADWERWNAKLRDAILPLQNRDKTSGGKKRSAFGSWDPYGPGWGKWGEMGSRVYTTAICVLTLEIYYRHTPAFLTEDVILTADAWRESLAKLSPQRRRDAIACLGALRFEIGEPVLVDLLREPDSGVALAAAEALAWDESPLGLAVLEGAVARLPPSGRRSTERALQRARDIAKLPPALGVVRAFDRGRRIATLELSRAYVGMPITIRRAGQDLARVRVVQRYTGRTEARAEIVGEPAGEPLAGDQALGQ